MIITYCVCVSDKFAVNPDRQGLSFRNLIRGNFQSMHCIKIVIIDKLWEFEIEVVMNPRFKNNLIMLLSSRGNFSKKIPVSSQLAPWV
jgi:hypothetical protein